MPPSKPYISLLTEYIDEVKKQECNVLSVLLEVIRTSEALNVTIKARPRMHLPSSNETCNQLKERMMKEKVYVLEDNFEFLLYGISTTIKDDVNWIASSRGLEFFETFSLLECVEEEDHLVLENDKYIGDILVDFGYRSKHGFGIQKLVLQKKKAEEANKNELLTLNASLDKVKANEAKFRSFQDIRLAAFRKNCTLQESL